MNARSLSTRLIIPLVAVTTIAVVALSIFLTISADQLAHGLSKQRALEVAEIITLKTEVNTTKGNLTRIVSSVGSNRDIDHVFIIDQNTNVIISSDQKEFIGNHVSETSMIAEFSDEIASTRHYRFDNFHVHDIHMLIYPYQAVSDDRKHIIPLVLVLITNEAELVSELIWFSAPAIATMLFILLLMSIFFFVFAKRILIKPIQTMTETLKRSDTKLEIVDYKKTDDELGTLIESYNQLVSSVQGYQTQLLEEKEKANAAAQAKSEFLATMTHELRTPLNGVIGMSQLLSSAKLDEVQSNYVKTIQQSGKQLLSLINDILDFSKIESGKIELDCQNFNLPENLQTLCDMMTPEAAKKGLTLSYAYDIRPEHHWLYGDEIRLNQVLINLIGNAIKFTHDGHIAITLNTLGITPKENGQPHLAFCISIRDTGIGITQQQIEKLFTRFTQADASTTRKYGGTGLGLAISKRLLEKMNGDISIESEVGKGTLFKIALELPITLDSLPLSKKQDTNDAWQNSRFVKHNQKPRILVVDDTPINLEIATAILEDEGMETDTASDGIEALKKVTEQQYDLILLDCLMPNMDGFDTARAIRLHEQKDSKSPVPIIALTASALKETQEKCLDAGMDDFASKPVDSSKLLETVRRWLLNRSNSA